MRTSKLAKARVGHRYAVQLQAALGTTPYHWKVIRGRLPRRLRLTRGGVLSGKPVHAGIYRFTVRVTDSGRSKMTATKRLVLEVRRA
ncbi:MAG: hypothetical protein JO153_22070 [Solirubrobacterales bacterium]|nr:hypothetical protein [Solirubrobacterales bacterium]